MTFELEPWERKHYAASGGEPFLYYVIYGDIDSSQPLSPGCYRSNGCPEGVDLMSYGPKDHPDVPGQFRDGYVWDEFVASDPEFSKAVEQCDQCMIMRGTPSDSATLNYLRDSVGLVTYLIDQGGCAVYDPFIFRWWHPSAWRQKVFEPASPVPHQHAVVFASPEDDPSRKWFHTRGMRKFGRPDISVHNVTPEIEDAVVDLCQRLIEHQALGHVVPEGQEITMASLPPGGVIRHRGHVDDPDFNNVHLDIRWPESA